jgi:asparagine synthetase B (glutamine-hydrolysing)
VQLKMMTQVLQRRSTVAPRCKPAQRRAVRVLASAAPAPKKVVLAYSGGLDTSIILKWLQDTYGCEVVTFTADLGQVREFALVHALLLQTCRTVATVDFRTSRT